MSVGITQAIRTAASNGVVTGDEMRAIIRQAEADGVVTADEQRVLRAFFETNTHALTDDARAQAGAFLRRYGNGDRDSAVPANEADSLRTVLASFDLVDTAAGIGNRDGLIARCDLQAIIDSPGANERLKAAAAALLRDFSRYDDAAGLLGREDGLIARCDIEAAIARTEMTPVRAIDVLRANFTYFDNAAGIGRRDGLVGAVDLQAAIRDANASAEVKAAARYMLENPDLFRQVDVALLGNAADGLISLGDLDVAREAHHMTERGAVETVLAHFDRCDDAARITGRNDGLIARVDLQGVIRDPSAPADVKAAARRLLDTPGLFDALDDAAGITGRNDGLIGRDDIRAWLHRTAPVPIAEPAPSQAPARGAARGGEIDRVNDDTENSIDDILTDPSLSIEDQVALVLILIAKQMDKQIEAQLKHIAELQKVDRDEKKSLPGARSDLASGNGSDSTSIDVEMVRLKRMIDKRSQMFDTLRQIVDKYNQTAKGVIDTIGR